MTDFGESLLLHQKPPRASTLCVIPLLSNLFCKPRALHNICTVPFHGFIMYKNRMNALQDKSPDSMASRLRSGSRTQAQLAHVLVSFRVFFLHDHQTVS